MKFVQRKLGSDDADYELIFGVLWFPLFAALVYLLARFHPFPIHCVLYRATGIPCPTCGSYRAAELLSVGDIAGAFAAQPLATALVLAACACALYSWVVVLGRMPRLRIVQVTRRERVMALIVAVLLVAANWAYLLLKYS